MSKEILKVGSLEAKSWEKRFGINEFPVDGRAYRLPPWLINGNADGPTLVVIAGVHGAEYASVAAALELGQCLDPKDLRGRSIYVCPLDGKNLNRVFPGNALGTASEQLADWVFGNVIRQADYYVDLHGGDLIEALIPFTIFFRSCNDSVDQLSLEMAQVFGIPCLVRSETPGSTFCAAARAGVPAILTEAGGQGIWRPEDDNDSLLVVGA